MKSLVVVVAERNSVVEEQHTLEVVGHTLAEAVLHSCAVAQGLVLRSLVLLRIHSLEERQNLNLMRESAVVLAWQTR